MPKGPQYRMAGSGRAQDWMSRPLAPPLQPSWLRDGMLQLFLRPASHDWEGKA